MRFTVHGAAAALVVASIAPAGAQAPPPMMVSAMNWSGLYAGVELGGEWSKFPGSVTVAAVPGSPAGSIPLSDKHGGGFSGGGVVGYNWQFPSNWVFGVEADFRAADTAVSTTLGVAPLAAIPVPFVGSDSFRGSQSWNGSARIRAGYAWGNVLPYVTVGAAFGDVNMRSNFIATTSGGFAFPASVASASETLVGWTAGAGLEYAMSPAWSLGAEYRYADYGSTTLGLGTLAVLATGTPAAPVFTNAAVSSKVGVESHSLMLKLNYHFGAPPPPPMPVAMPAPPPPAPKVFIVFFDWDKDVVTPQGMQIVQQAADAYKAGAPVQIQITGYTDRSGSPGYNQRLSERRANNVAKAMAAMGVPKSQMAVSGRGENDNRVATADGVREPQNRRVEIVTP